MEILILGGTHHVGRCAVEVALAAGHSVTTLNRGLTGVATPGVRPLIADRTNPLALEQALGDAQWDAVIDTWNGVPAVVEMAASLLSDRAGHYGYVSSRSVYTWPVSAGADESAPVVDANPGSVDVEDYPERKRGAELAALTAFTDRCLIARPGLILGPYEIVGRLPWWLRRIERGGRVLSPGPIERPLQYIDGRDLAGWMIDCADRGLGGIYNTVSRAGHTTIGGLLETCRTVVGADAELVWTPPETIETTGIEAWTELPIWLPPTGEAVGLHDSDVSAAFAAGLSCRPVRETIEATWRWLLDEGDPESLSSGAIGLDPVKEKHALAVTSS